MALHFNCPFCGHSQHYESAPAGGFTACPECDETLPESYQASPAGEGPAASEAVAGGGEAPVDAEFLHEPPTPEVMPTIAGGEASLPHPRRKPSYTWVWLLVGALVVLPIGACMLMLPALNASREAARRNGCLNKMRIIALALQQYEYEHGRLPPAYIADADGKPMHSWRVLILPYLEERGLYEQYDFSQPWDSENNLRVAEQIPWFYQCPSDADLSQYNHTSYMVIVGDDTFFPGSESCSMADCRDYPDSTLVVVEVADSETGWTEPVDLLATEMNWQINGNARHSIGSEHSGNGAMVMFADGTVAYLRSDISPADVEAFSTIDGGEQVQRPR